ncbi:MAG: 3-deoxy-D-manno-octulosonic acid transferase [Magnetococcus sp. DMHC-1]|nr:3-deoxy-D-manno-octulosonic acid transferase [Magnetococcales bacterium]
MRLPDKYLYGLYTGLFSLLGLVSLPFMALRVGARSRYQGTLAQRLGHIPKSICQDLEQNACFWVHAVSVGEALAAQGLIEALHRCFPGLRVVVSTVTKTGQQVVRDRLTCVDHLIYLPLDLPGIIERVVPCIRPRFVIIMETELWPNLFHALEKSAIPIILVNGRLSPRSFARYRRMAWAMGRFLQPVHLFCMQSPQDADRMRQIHPSLSSPQTVSCDHQPARPHLLVTGNLKYDQAMRLPTQTEMVALQQRTGPTPPPIWLAASTHPGEETLILDTFYAVRQHIADLRLILVPRHPERASLLDNTLTQKGFSFRLFSQTRGNWTEPVLLVDEIGWLTRLYGLAQIVFVGGSLIPHGGQNFLEPAAWGIPPIFGPHVFNFRDAARQILEARAGFQVQDAVALEKIVLHLLQNPSLCQETGQRAKNVVMTHAGALERTVQAIQATLRPFP